MRMRTAINTLYIAFLVLVTIGFPLLLLLATAGTWEAGYGTAAAVLSFIILGSYVIYTLLLGRKNS